MQRTPEPELMDDTLQAQAYADADFSDTDDAFVDRFVALLEGTPIAAVADLGCGPGNIALRVGTRLPGVAVVAVDGAAAMLDIGRDRAIQCGLGDRVQFVAATLPDPALSVQRFDAIVSNSLLHHLHDPQVLWQTLKAIAQPGACVLIRDLRRPASREHARSIVDRYATDAPPVLQEDFYNSLCAAFEVDEIRAQLAEARLAGLTVTAIGDRHVEISGRMA